MDLYSDSRIFDRASPGLRRLSRHLIDLGNSPREFPEASPRDTLRVLCVGGSSTAGWPFHPKGGYPEWLRLLLGDALGRPVEVINAGIFAYGVHEDTRIVRELKKLRWDLIIAYEGTNLMATADQCRPLQLRWQLRTDLFFAQRSQMYLWFKNMLRKRHYEVKHRLWKLELSDPLRSCLARHLNAGLSELAEAAKGPNRHLLIIAPIRNGPLWQGGRILESLSQAVRQEGLLMVDAEEAAGKFLISRAPRHVGDNVHPTLQAHWAIAMETVHALADSNWPQKNALKLQKIKNYKSYAARLGITKDFLASAHACLGYKFIRTGLHAFAWKEFENAEELKPGIVASLLGPLEGLEVLEWADKFYRSRNAAHQAYRRHIADIVHQRRAIGIGL